MRADRAPEPREGTDRTDGTSSAIRSIVRSTGLLALCVSVAVLAGACTEDSLTGPGPEEGEKDAAETVELALTPSQMATWRDTTFTGFAVSSDAPFVFLANGPDLRSRALLRYLVADSAVVDDDTLGIAEYVDGRVRLVLDTARTTVPEDGVTFRVFPLTRSFTSSEATWEQAADGESWTDPGGDFADEVGRLEIAEPTDSVLTDTLDIPLGSDTDSLLTAWSASDGEPGLAALVDTEGARVQVREAILDFEARPEGRDTLVGGAVATFGNRLPSTFISEPSAPPPGNDRLRVGGLPASRLYLSFRPPLEVDGERIEGSTVNRAEIVLRPASPPSEPFALAHTVDAAAVRLLADPFELGPGTPIGGALEGGNITLDPDSLAAGSAIRFELTDEITRWASNPDSAGSLGVAVLLRPDAQTLGFWEFGSSSSAAGLQPFLRVLFTPRTEFDVP